MLCALLALSPAGCGSECQLESSSQALRHLMIVAIDALRADTLGCYGADTALIPEIDQLAQHGLVFASAHINATFTFPSTASLFTSTLPPVHHTTHDEKRQVLLRRLSNRYTLLPAVPV